MILKSYETQKINLEKNKIILLYGKNEGQKKEILKKLIINKDITYYEQNEVLEKENEFLENLSSKSLFDKEKIIIIKRANDKLLNLVEKINLSMLEDVNIIINTDILEKRSKIRSKFEKDKNYICIAFYPDDQQTLVKLSFNFFKENKIAISPSSINLIVSKCSGNREALFDELNKIKYYSSNKKIISEENINKLINLNENHSISELIDNCLAKNNKKIIYILNENNFGTDDTVLIIRTFLNKSKRILKLREDFEKNNNIDTTISTAKPPVFWKDKEITKSQINKWTSENLKELTFKLGEIELLIKKNIGNSINLITDFIIEQSKVKTNN
tara:strand:+ start:2548 stop:3537 length:990 start_codon:yes stop_codon:yes gene_type:complete